MSWTLGLDKTLVGITEDEAVNYGMIPVSLQSPNVNHRQTGGAAGDKSNFVLQSVSRNRCPQSILQSRNGGLQLTGRLYRVA